MAWSLSALLLLKIIVSMKRYYVGVLGNIEKCIKYAVVFFKVLKNLKVNAGMKNSFGSNTHYYHDGVCNTRTISSTRQTGQTRVTNSWTATHQSWLVRCSTRALGFSWRNLNVCQNLIFMSSLISKVGFCLTNVFSSKMFVYHCQLVAADWSSCWNCVAILRG